jgi:Golgi phosphoprotein 3 (GPP34)
MLMAEELALIAMNPRRRSPGLGTHQHLNACLAGLLLGDLVVTGAAELRPRDTIVLVPGPSLLTGTLAGAAQVVAEKGPNIKSILSGMDRGLHRHLGRGTWDAVLAGLSEGVDGREKAIERLRAAAASDEPIEARTALVLSMTGPARLLELMAPHHGSDRRHARERIDHATDGMRCEPISRAVRKIISEDQAAATSAAMIPTY